MTPRFEPLCDSLKLFVAVPVLAIVLGCGGGSGAGGAPGGSGATNPTHVNITVLAGLMRPKSTGTADGTGGAARFQTPAGAVTDSSGNTFVTDANSHAIRKITPQGQVTTFAGQKLYSGHVDGQGTAIRFSVPWGIALEPGGNLIVSELGNCTLRRITPSGLTTTLAGTPGMPGTADGAASTAQFAQPTGLAVDAAGNIFVTDTASHTIRKVTPAGEVSTFAGSPNAQGWADGQGTAARFSYPGAVAIGPSGALYIADSYNFCIRKITPGGEVSTLAGSGADFDEIDGPLATARFNVPVGITCDASETLFVTENSGVIRKISPAGEVTTLAGVPHRFGYQDGTGSSASFEAIGAISLHSGGGLLVVDGNALRKVSSAGTVSFYVGAFGSSGSLDGAGPEARFTGVGGMDFLPNGDLLVADEGNVTLRRVTSDGVVTTEAGTPRVNGIRDGFGSVAVFMLPQSLAVVPSGEAFIVDTGNSAIRRIENQNVTTFAGYPMLEGSEDGVGLSARFRYPSGIVAAASGDLYVSDSSNQTIRKVSLNGMVSTFAGSAGLSGNQDGTGSGIRFNNPRALAWDSGGNLLVSDTGNGTLRRVAVDGTSQTVTSGLLAPDAIACDAAGNIYVATVGPVSVKKISPSGAVSTFAAFTTGTASVPAQFPGEIIAIRGMKARAGYLYVSADNAVLKIGPLP